MASKSKPAGREPVAHPYVQALNPYKPGKPMAQVMAEYGLERVVKLASNESPLGPSPDAIDAYKAAADSLWLYPDNDATALRAQIAEKNGVMAEQVVLSAGSSHLLELLVRAYAGPGRKVVYSAHGFICYPLLTQAVGATGVPVPEVDYTAQPEAMAAACDKHTALLFLANPNNPTGTTVSKPRLEKMLQAIPPHVLVVLDEAYAEYAQYEGVPDCTDLLEAFPNLVIARTLSKAYGLAGLRVGYGMASPKVASILNRLRAPFTLSVPALAAASVALADEDHLLRVVHLNTGEKMRVSHIYHQLGLLACNSRGNFLLLDMAATGRDVDDLFTQLQKQGVIVRPVKEYGLPTHLRLSIGKPAENNLALDHIRALVEGQ